MKKISTLIVCLLLVSFVFAGVPAVSRLAEPKIVEAQDSDRLDQLLTIVAKKVSEIPAIDGDFSDPAWVDTTAIPVGSSVWKAVYTDDELAIYIRWMDHDASVNTRGTWNWDADTQSWWRTAWEGETRQFFGTRGFPEWFDIAFDISSDVSDTPITEVGCGAFCHEYPPGSGKFHHQTSGTGAYVDSWAILGKHGYKAPLYDEDDGWPLGVTSVSQEGELIFNPSDPAGTLGLINGSITFVGYAEDRVMASPDDPKFAARDTVGDQYCQKCHTDLGLTHDPLLADFTYADPGDILYAENWDDVQAVPLYMELAPENFVDCMVLTQAEIDAGEAVLIADLSEIEFAEAWNNYTALNGVVPHLILQEPSGSQADVRVAANWHNGFWTVELKRNLVTDSEYDVQFDDLSRDYRFGVSLWARGQDTVRVGRYAGWTLRFGQ